jgi:hypothetical protein
MTKKCCVVLAILAACTDPSESGEVTVQWALDSDVTVGDWCTRILIGMEAEAGESKEATCDAISVDLTFDDTPTTIDVQYRYIAIPFGCESESCWREESFAAGSAPYTSGSTSVQVRRLIVNPF